MSNYLRKAKRNSIEKTKTPRCCGRRMFMNKYGLWQCKKCGRQKFDIGSKESESIEAEVVTTNDAAPNTDVTDSTIIEVEPEVIE